MGVVESSQEDERQEEWGRKKEMNGKSFWNRYLLNWMQLDRVTPPY